MKRATPAVVNPSVSAAVTSVKTMPAPSTVPIKTLGMVNLDFHFFAQGRDLFETGKREQANESPIAMDDRRPQRPE